MQNNNTKLIQSWSDLFPDEVVKQLDLATPEKRSDYFMELWDDWASTEIDLTPYHKDLAYKKSHRHEWYIESPVRAFAKKQGLREFWEFQVRGNAIRFADEDTALHFRLSI